MALQLAGEVLPFTRVCGGGVGVAGRGGELALTFGVEAMLGGSPDVRPLEKPNAGRRAERPRAGHAVSPSLGFSTGLGALGLLPLPLCKRKKKLTFIFFKLYFY